MLLVFLKAVLCGFVASIPVGPTGVYVINTSLSKGRGAGFVAGIGSAVADTIYAAIALTALTAVQTFVNNNSQVISILGGAVIIFMGVMMTISNPFKHFLEGEKKVISASPSDFFKAVLLALSNPGSIIAIFGMMSVFGVATTSVAEFAIALLGVCVGASAYWTLVSFAFSKLRRVVHVRTLVWINRCMGIFIIFLGIFLAVSGLVTGTIIK